MAINQVVWLFLGVVLMIAIMAFLRNPDRLANYKYTLAIVGVILLLSPMIPGVGQEIYGSRIWLHVGGFSFQPGEDREGLLSCSSWPATLRRTARCSRCSPGI